MSMEHVDRAEVVANLRRLADMIEECSLPVTPYVNTQVSHYADSIDEVRKIREQHLGGWVKEDLGNFFSYHLNAGTGKRTSVQYRVLINKRNTCKRVVTGSRHIEAHDEEIVEWRCEET